MYLNQIKVKPGNYADSFNVWIPNIEEFIKELEQIKNDKGGCSFFINKNKSFDKNGNVAFHVKSLDGNLKLADLPETKAERFEKVADYEPETETTDDELPF
jgi:hypothetical protein